MQLVNIFDDIKLAYFYAAAIRIIADAAKSTTANSWLGALLLVIAAADMIGKQNLSQTTNPKFMNLQHRASRQLTASNRFLRLAVLSLTFGFVLLMKPLAFAAESRSKWMLDEQRACDRGSMQECLNLAVGHARGEVQGKKVERDANKSKQFTERAITAGNDGCRQGNLKYCYLLGVLYFEGELTPTDYGKGIEYARKACVGGYKEACEWLKNSGVQ
jgi:TPR repeat protein